jgi:ComF family protein
MSLYYLRQRLLDLVWPRHCVSCRTPGNYICNKCLANLPAADLIEEKNSFALFEYDDARVKKLIWQLKYRGITAIADTFGPLLYQQLLETLANWQTYHPQSEEKWLVIPIPLSRERYRHRGYNQAELLARALVKTKSELFELATGKELLKIKDTPSQVSIKDRAKRLKNLKAAFACSESSLVRGRRIILVDDVITTGATMTAARQVLTKAGARSLISLAIAHG